MTWKPKKEMDSILCHMMSKILRDAWEELLIVTKINKDIKNWERMLSRVLSRKQMLLEGGTVNSIGYKTKFTLIGIK